MGTSELQSSSNSTMASRSVLYILVTFSKNYHKDKALSTKQKLLSLTLIVFAYFTNRSEPLLLSIVCL